MRFKLFRWSLLSHCRLLNTPRLTSLRFCRCLETTRLFWSVWLRKKYRFMTPSFLSSMQERGGVWNLAAWLSWVSVHKSAIKGISFQYCDLPAAFLPPLSFFFFFFFFFYWTKRSQLSVIQSYKSFWAMQCHTKWGPKSSYSWLELEVEALLSTVLTACNLAQAWGRIQINIG